MQDKGPECDHASQSQVGLQTRLLHAAQQGLTRTLHLAVGALCDTTTHSSSADDGLQNQACHTLRVVCLPCVCRSPRLRGQDSP